MHYHFIAIGGSAMHNLALALHKSGATVTGSDDEIFEPAKSRLQNHGLLPPEIGWFPQKIQKMPDAIILGMHAKKDNPELLEAERLGIRIFSYPEFLYEAFKTKKRVVIGGSHGKTTITSMILHVLKSAGINTDYMVGAQLDGFDDMVSIHADSHPVAILEGDEYLTSPIDLRPKFHLYMPHIAVISGIAWDHINVFPTFENYLEQFVLFIHKIESGGVLIYNSDDPEVVRAVQLANRKDIRLLSYSVAPHSVIDGTTRLELPHTNPVFLEIFGKHNLSNLMAAKAVCNELGVTDSEFTAFISTFHGAAKRLELLYKSESGVAYKDFAHSPSKLLATTMAVRSQYPERKLLACMELHTYSSLNQTFLNEYKNSLNDADIAVVFYSPHAVELKRLKAISPDDIRTAFGRNDLHVFTNKEDLEAFILSQSSRNLNLLMMSSGNWDGLDLIKLSTACLL